MKKRKSNYNAIIKKRSNKKNITTEADSFLRLKVEDIPDPLSRSPNKSGLRKGIDSPLTMNDSLVLLQKPIANSPIDEKLSEILSNNNELKDSNNTEEHKNTSQVLPKDSTGGSGQNNTENGRTDRFGVKIQKGRKKHKVTFKDQIGKGKVAKVHMVESYKKYNVESSTNTWSWTIF